jgi:cell division protein FtsB
MGVRISDWFSNIGSTSKAVVALIAIILLTISATLSVAQQIKLPARVAVVEADIGDLKQRAETNRKGIEEIRQDTQSILCIITLPASISPAEARLRCP